MRRYPMILMKNFSLPAACAAVALAMLLPSARVQSQMAPLSDDPLTALQTLQKANDDLLKRQDDTLKTLTDLNATANEVRLFSRRG